MLTIQSAVADEPVRRAALFVKVANFTIPHLYLAPLQKVTLLEFLLKSSA